MESSDNKELKDEVIKAVLTAVTKKIDNDMDDIKDDIKSGITDDILAEAADNIDDVKSDLEDEIEHIREDVDDIKRIVEDMNKKLEEICRHQPSSMGSITTPPAVAFQGSPAGSHPFATAMDAFCEATTEALLSLYTNALALKKRLLG